MKTFNEYMQDQSINEAPDFEKVGKQIAKLTDNNDHTSALLLAAEVFGSTKYINIMKAIQTIHNEERSIPEGIRIYRESIRKQLDSYGKKKFGDNWTTYVYQNM